MRNALYMIFVLAMTAGSVAECNGYSIPDARHDTNSLLETETTKVDTELTFDAGAHGASQAKSRKVAVNGGAYV